MRVFIKELSYTFVLIGVFVICWFLFFPNYNIPSYVGVIVGVVLGLAGKALSRPTKRAADAPLTQTVQRRSRGLGNDPHRPC